MSYCIAMERRPASDRRAAFSLGAPLLAAAAVALAAPIASALSITTADGRYVTIMIAAALALVGGYLARPGAKLRALFVALSLPWLAAILFPRSSLAVTWLSGSVLFLGAEATLHAGRTAFRATRRTESQPPRAGRAILLSLVTLTSLVLIAGAGIVIVNMQMLVAPARLGHRSPTVSHGEVFAEFVADDGVALRGTYGAGTDGAPGVVLVHGVSDGRDRWLPWAEQLGAAGVHSLRLDLRAHGLSDGAVCTYGQREAMDVLAAARWMADQPGVGDLVVVGTSMGSGTVLSASRDLNAKAFILLAPAADYAELVARRVSLLGPLVAPVLAVSAPFARSLGQTPMTGWSPGARMNDEVPTLVIHGVADRTIPIASSRELAGAHDNVRLIELPGVGHDEIPAAAAGDDETWATVRAFIDGR